MYRIEPNKFYNETKLILYSVQALFPYFYKVSENFTIHEDFSGQSNQITTIKINHESLLIIKLSHSLLSYHLRLGLVLVYSQILGTMF